MIDETSTFNTIHDEHDAREQATSGEESEEDRFAGMSGAELSRAIDVEIAKLS